MTSKSRWGSREPSRQFSSPLSPDGPLPPPTLNGQSRVPSYYDASSDYPQFNNNSGKATRKGPLVSIRKSLRWGGSIETRVRNESRWEGMGDLLPPNPNAGCCGSPLAHMGEFAVESPSMSVKTSSVDLLPGMVARSFDHKLHEEPGGLSRVVQKTHLKFTDERMKTYVVIEVFEGHRIIKNWKCGDLVWYVNYLGTHTPQKETAGKKVSSQTQETAEAERPEHSPSPSERQQSAEIPTPLIHHHYYFNNKRFGVAGMPQPGASRSLTSRLTYRDLRQVFTDGAPVPSIEVRRHCLVLCLPPLSCIIMKDRVFLLVVEEMHTDRLISSLEEMQLRRVGKHKEVEKRHDRKGQSSLDETQDTRTGKLKASDSQPLVGSGNDDKTPEMENPPTQGSGQLEEVTVEGRRVGWAVQTEGGEKEQQREEEEEKNAEFPMEFEALELMVCGAFELLDSDISHLERTYMAIASTLTRPTPEGGEDLHLLKNHTDFYTDRVALFDKAFDDLISNTEDLVRMELSRDSPTTANLEGFAPRVWSEGGENEEVEESNPDLEILLEFFDQELEMFRQRLSRLSAKLDSTERLFTLKLSLTRNRILKWEFGSTMAGVAIGTGTLLSGIFGMNLKSHLEESKQLFDIISIGIAIFTVISFISIFIIIQSTRL